MHAEVARGLVYVAECAGEQIKLVCRSTSYSAELGKLGYAFQPLTEFYAEIFQNIEGMYFVKTYQDQRGKLAEMEMLRDNDIPFATGKGWSPSDVVEHFRERGDLHGTFLRICWLDAQRFEFESF